MPYPKKGRLKNCAKARQNRGKNRLQTGEAPADGSSSAAAQGTGSSSAAAQGTRSPHAARCRAPVPR
eukprot:CAMPEP_0174929882 /NCGR_PEP_ID=MMETSP1355-20121228/29243_1 /TAXON_ID=464990 /ORGANISM="Hemiselmis tepida, Strain CCMP443" /LENGTH=66 /DNA_ID=CAMNT_0016176133 /DNA_START=139 /DNA_END=335 /DNA_ORIENTATION=-